MSARFLSVNFLHCLVPSQILSWEQWRSWRVSYYPFHKAVLSVTPVIHKMTMFFNCQCDLMSVICGAVNE